MNDEWKGTGTNKIDELTVLKISLEKNTRDNKHICQRKREK